MAGNLFVLPKQVPIDGGVVLPGAKLTFTKTGTTTPQNTFTDVALTVAHANPVVADSEGVFAAIYFDPTFDDYRVKLDTSADVLVYQVDGIPASQSGQSLTLTAAAPFIDLIENDASANNGVWRIAVNGEQLTVKLGNDALSSFTDILTIDRTANTVDTIDLLPTNLQHNGVDISAVSTGNFTPTYTGFSADPTGTANWTLNGSSVNIRLGFINGTSDATTMTVTNLPANLTPSLAQIVPIVGLHDNTADSAAVGSVLISGTTLTFGLDGDNVLGGGFTNSGTKGLQNANVSISYSLMG